MSSSESAAPKRHELSLNLGQALEIMRVGVRRAAAFLKISTTIEEDQIPKDLTLGGGVAFGFWPTPIPDDVREKLHSEFKGWIVGSCIKELDSHFALFLDQVRKIIQLAELHGKTVHSSDTIKYDKRFLDNTNCARKADELSKLIGMEFDAVSLDSLSRARNALSHGAGRVRERDANDKNKALEISWLAHEIVIQDGDKELPFREFPADTYQVSAPEGARVFARTVKRNVVFPIGEKVSFSEQDLAEICFFYLQNASRFHDALLDYLKTRGIHKIQKAKT